MAVKVEACVPIQPDEVHQAASSAARATAAFPAPKGSSRLDAPHAEEPRGWILTSTASDPKSGYSKSVAPNKTVFTLAKNAPIPPRSPAVRDKIFFNKGNKLLGVWVTEHATSPTSIKTLAMDEHKHLINLPGIIITDVKSLLGVEQLEPLHELQSWQACCADYCCSGQEISKSIRKDLLCLPGSSGACPCVAARQ
eukprot:6211405-Pleurochrysis_carterae.AAC.1